MTDKIPLMLISNENTKHGISYNKENRTLYINTDGLWTLNKVHYLNIATGLLTGLIQLDCPRYLQEEIKHMVTILGLSPNEPVPSKNYKKILEFFTEPDYNDNMITRIFKEYPEIQYIITKDDNIETCKDWSGNVFLINKNNWSVLETE